MNRLSIKERAAIVAALVEGNGIRATCRLTGAAKGTVLKLLADLGTACADYQDAGLRGLPCKRVQIDEIWAFCYAKEKNVPEDKRGVFGYGDVWTFVAICRDTKLVPCWMLTAIRDRAEAVEFLKDLRRRVSGRVQISSDGHGMYADAVEAVFGELVDYGQIVKEYGTDATETRYSPAKCLSVKRQKVLGDPDMRAVSTSHVERQNLTMRMGMRRFTRLTNGFSKKLANLEAAVALHFLWYNFGRPHASLGGKTPAQAAGIDRYRWTAEDVAALLDAREASAS